ncbi:MAG: acetyl-CoA carboxylase biotin carboxyl carrier protein [Desulfuromonadales bacterium]|nr:acetyl-CoA carboxylase biotin carboxyl carrier protein [Desulfuromonadales bacterium]
MELKDLKSLIKLVTDTDITEFNMESAVGKIHIKRGPDKEIVYTSAPVAAAPAVAAPAPVAAPAATPAGEKEVNSKYEAIPSPIVGTFYRKPSPEADAFCKIGDVVEAGQVLCLVEAMKMFNEIEVEFKCKIIEIVKDDATPVEYGETLFLVERL